jgi:hypothetical protein
LGIAHGVIICARQVAQSGSGWQKGRPGWWMVETTPAKEGEENLFRY